MAKWVFSSQSWTPIVVADATNFTNQGYMALQGGSSTQAINIYEVFIAGLATASAVTPLVLGRDSTVGATLSALTTFESNGAIGPFTAALAAPQQPFTQSTTKPQRSSTLAKLILGLNAFGGIVRWTANDPTQVVQIYGNTASLGEASLSCSNAGAPGLVAADIKYEPL